MMGDSRCIHQALLALLCVAALVGVSAAPQDPYFACHTPTVFADRRVNKPLLAVAQFAPNWVFPWGSAPFCPSACPFNSSEMLAEHISRIAYAIRQTNADIITITEYFDCVMVDQLLMILVGMDYRGYLLKGSDATKGQTIALLTKLDPTESLQPIPGFMHYPIPGSSCGYTGPPGETNITRGFFTTMKVNGRVIKLIAVQLIESPTEPLHCAIREAQAVICRSLIDSFMATNTEVIMLGDFADYDPDLRDASGSVPVSKAIQILKRGTNNSAPAASQLYNVATVGELASSTIYTWDTGTHLRAIDHIFISQFLVQTVTQVYYKNNLYPPCPAPCTTTSEHWPVFSRMDFTQVDGTIKPAFLLAIIMTALTIGCITIGVVASFVNQGSPSIRN